MLEWLEQPGHRFEGEVLVPGCGLGHDVRAIAATGQARVLIGLDYAPAAVAQARRQPPAGNESYVEADLFALPPEFCGRFDWVVEHTCFCAIDPARRADYVRAVAGALRPGGHLLAIFYLQPWNAGEPSPPGGGPPLRREPGRIGWPVCGTFRAIGGSDADARLSRAGRTRTDPADAGSFLTLLSLVREGVWNCQNAVILSECNESKDLLPPEAPLVSDRSTGVKSAVAAAGRKVLRLRYTPLRMTALGQLRAPLAVVLYLPQIFSYHFPPS